MSNYPIRSSDYTNAWSAKVPVEVQFVDGGQALRATRWSMMVKAMAIHGLNCACIDRLNLE